MRTAEEYIVCRAGYGKHLEENVSDKIEEGYQPFGSVFTDRNVPCQPMVKYVSNEYQLLKETLTAMIGEVREMQENGCSDTCIDMAHNLKIMYEELLK